MPPADSPADEVARLYSLAPQDFVAERNATVKAWKREGRKGEAAALAALRKPSAVESALNRTATRDPATMRAWADAARSADAAQNATIGGADAAELRRAMAELRAATGALVDAAVTTIGDEAKRDDIAGLLRSLSVGGVDQVVAGVLGSTTIATDDLFAGAPTPPPRARDRREAGAATAPVRPASRPVPRRSPSHRRRGPGDRRRVCGRSNPTSSGAGPRSTRSSRSSRPPAARSTTPAAGWSCSRRSAPTPPRHSTRPRPSCGPHATPSREPAAPISARARLRREVDRERRRPRERGRAQRRAIKR